VPDFPLPDLDDVLGPEVIPRNRLYHPEAAPIKAPNASDWANSASADGSSSRVVVPPVVPPVFPLALAAGEPPGAVVKVALTLDSGETGAAATEAEGTLGDGEDMAIVPVSVTLSVVNAITNRKAEVAMNAARRPASHEAFGAKKPAIIGGMSGTGTNRNSAMTVTNGSLVVPSLPIRVTM
jgi:hypothetical protein